MFDVKIEGEEELIAALKGLPMKISNEAAFETLVVALQPTVDAAKAYAPVKTGSLQRSIGAVIRKYRRGTLVFGLVGCRRGYGTDGNEPANYAHLVEYGHRIAKLGGKTLRKGGEVIGTVPPYPFLRPAWEATKELVLATIAKEFAARVESAAKSRKAA